MNSLLLKILTTETESGNQEAMRELILAELAALGCNIETDTAGNIYATKGTGKTLPCFAAHMDTVHGVTGDGIAVCTLNGLATGINPKTMQQTGIGGDDKCGIYCALECLRRLPACKVVFFTDEEIGCIGASQCDLGFFSDCRWVISADRRGREDFVTDIGGALSSEKFQRDVAPLLKKHGLKPCQGALADVMELRDRQVGVSVANMSAAYYNPHTPGEYINLNELEEIISFLIETGEKLTKRYPFTYTRPASKPWPGSLSPWPNDPWDSREGMFPDYSPGRGDWPTQEQLDEEEKLWQALSQDDSLGGWSQ